MTQTFMCTPPAKTPISAGGRIDLRVVEPVDAQLKRIVVYMNSFIKSLRASMGLTDEDFFHGGERDVEWLVDALATDDVLILEIFYNGQSAGYIRVSPDNLFTATTELDEIYVLPILRHLQIAARVFEQLRYRKIHAFFKSVKPGMGDPKRVMVVNLPFVIEGQPNPKSENLVYNGAIPRFVKTSNTQDSRVRLLTVRSIVDIK